MKRATEAAIKHASLIKQKLFMLETIGDGDEELLSVLLADQSCSCDTDSDSGGSS